MIGAPTLDPREGDRRRKALQSALQRSVQQRTGMSRFARTGIGRGSMAGFGRRPVSMGGRPSGILSFLSNKAPSGFARGLAAYAGRSGGLGRLIEATQLPTATLPAPGAPSAPVGGGGGGGITPSAPSTTASGSLSPDNPDPNGEFSDTNGDGWVVVSGGPEGYDSSLAAPVMTPGADWIPLGGGLFIDPATGVLHGGMAGGVSGGLRA